MEREQVVMDQVQPLPALIPFSTVQIVVPLPSRETSPQERQEKCAWCWSRRHPQEPYPQHWSSTICVECNQEVRACLEERRRRKEQANGESTTTSGQKEEILSEPFYTDEQTTV